LVADYRLEPGVDAFDREGVADMTTPIYDALCQDIRDLAPAEGEATPWAFHQLITDTATLIDKGGFNMTCQRCGEVKAADGDDWCGRCEDEDAAQALAALRVVQPGTASTTTIPVTLDWAAPALIGGA
jgi:hypothetical protein